MSLEVSKPLMNSADNQTPQRPNVEPARAETIKAQLNIGQECDFPGTETLTALKVCIDYEFHREGALEDCETAKLWLEQKHPGWDNLPWKKVPLKLRQEQTQALKRTEVSDAIRQLVPATLPDNLVELARAALASSRLPLVTLPPEATALQLAKIEGLTRGKYLEFINSKRGGIASELIILELDWALHDETMVAMFRCLLELSRPRDALDLEQPIPAIHHEKGKSSTYKQLQVVLNALIVYRLLKRGNLSIPEAIQALEKAHLKAPYSQNREQRWRDAEGLAFRFLKELKADRFVEAVQNFVVTHQARKIFGAPI